MSSTERDAEVRELRRHAALMEILSQVSRVALQADDLGELLDRVVRFLAERLPVTFASIILLDDSGERFENEVWAGDVELLPPGQTGEWPVSVGLAGRCARTGRPELVLNVRDDPDYVPGNTAVEAAYLVPIEDRGRVLGVIDLESTSAEVFTPEALQVFDAIADQIAGAVRLSQVNRQLEEANRELQRLTGIDPLTGLANRRRFDEALDVEWRRACRHGETLALLLADADCFKQLNDTSGHHYGDECLRLLARVFACEVSRAADLVARYGGEELAVLLPATALEPAVRLAERIRQQVQAKRMPHLSSPVAPFVTISIGVAAANPGVGESHEDLLRRADAALYRAKASGRNRIEVAAKEPPEDSALRLARPFD